MRTRDEVPIGPDTHRPGARPGVTRAPGRAREADEPAPDCPSGGPDAMISRVDTADLTLAQAAQRLGARRRVLLAAVIAAGIDLPRAPRGGYAIPQDMLPALAEAVEHYRAGGEANRLADPPGRVERSAARGKAGGPVETCTACGSPAPPPARVRWDPAEPVAVLSGPQPHGPQREVRPPYRPLPAPPAAAGIAPALAAQPPTWASAASVWGGGPVVVCPICRGDPTWQRTCVPCGGTGIVAAMLAAYVEPCPGCYGTGRALFFGSAGGCVCCGGGPTWPGTGRVPAREWVRDASRLRAGGRPRWGA